MFSHRQYALCIPLPNRLHNETWSSGLSPLKCHSNFGMNVKQLSDPRPFFKGQMPVVEIVHLSAASADARDCTSTEIWLLPISARTSPSRTVLRYISRATWNFKIWSCTSAEAIHRHSSKTITSFLACKGFLCTAKEHTQYYSQWAMSNGKTMVKIILFDAKDIWIIQKSHILSNSICHQNLSATGMQTLFKVVISSNSLPVFTKKCTVTQRS